MIWPFTPKKSARELLLALGQENHEQRLEGFKGLRDCDDPETDWLILQALKNWQSLPQDRVVLLVDLVGIRGIEEGTEILKDLLLEEDCQCREMVVRALGRVPSQRTLDVLLPLLADADPTIRNSIRKMVMEIYHKEAMGAIIRTIPKDRTAPLYFELVTLFEEMGFFDDLKENFLHHDHDVRGFHIRNMQKFHRPEFVPLYLDYAKTASSEALRQIQEILMDYSPDDLIPPFRDYLSQENPPEPLIRLASNILFTQFPDAREHLLPLVSAVPRADLQVRFLEQLLRQPDIYLFTPLFPFLTSANAGIRKIAATALLQIARSTVIRLKDPDEPKHQQLKEMFSSWQAPVTSIILSERRSEEIKDGIPVLFALAEHDYSMLFPLMTRLISNFFADTLQALARWPSTTVFELLKKATQLDPSLVSLLVSTLGRTAHPLLLRGILKILPELDLLDRETIQRKLAGRTTVFKPSDFFDDTDADVRASALQIAALSAPPDLLFAALEKRLKDPAAEVRRVAVQILLQTRHPKLADLLQDALGDPAPDIVLTAVKGLADILQEASMVLIYKKLTVSPVEELRSFALSKIARLTQTRFVENFNRLSPEVRKLAGAAIQKLDGSFVEQVSEELRSLDPAARLRAALILENMQINSKTKDALLEAMKDPDKKVRAAVVKTLGVLGDRDLLSRLIEFFNDPDERVRANAIEGVLSIGDQSAIRLLLPFLEDGNNRIRGNAILAIWHISKANVYPVLRKMLNEKEVLMQASALWVIGEIGNETYLPLLVPFLIAPDEILRLNAVRAAGKIKPDILKPHLANLRKDPSAEVRKQVLELSKRIL